MYDECAYNENNGKKINCLYNNKAKLLTDKDGLELLQEVCPYLYKSKPMPTQHFYYTIVTT